MRGNERPGRGRGGASICGQPYAVLPVMLRRQVGIAFISLSAACGAPEVVSLDQIEPIHDLELPEGLLIERGTISTDQHSHLRVVLYVTNHADEVARFGHGPCFVRLRGYDSEELSEPAIWSDQREDPWFCADVGTLQMTTPQATDSLVTTVNPSQFVSWPPPDEAVLGAS